jgi:hypothetical protein
MGKVVSSLFTLFKIVAVLLAAASVGNWFLTEVKKARITGKPWYQPYLSIPGILIMLALLLPVLWWLIRN